MKNATKQKNSEMLEKIFESIQSAKSSLDAAEKWAKKIESEGVAIKKAEPTTVSDALDQKKNVVEGIFDGQNMIDNEGNTYPVQPNYASKSKLVEGDRLKLTISENGAFLFKQIKPVERKMLVGDLILDGSQYKALIGDKTYFLIYASITFHHARVGDRVTVIIPAEKPAKWACLENVLPGQ